LPSDTQRMDRYRKQSINLLQSALQQIKQGHWTRSEDLLWGSLTLAVKGVAVSRGDQLTTDEEVREYTSRLGNEQRDRRLREYTSRLGNEQRDRRLREAFTQLSNFGDAVERLRESRFRVDRIIPMLEDVSSAIERLWEMVPMADSTTESPSAETEIVEDTEQDKV
jgi:hypothetical protein